MRLFVAYAVSVVVSLLGILAVMSSLLVANDAPLSGQTGLALSVAATASFLIFLILVRGAVSSMQARILHGLLASVVLPPLIAFSPLLLCIFVTHGTCS